MSMPPCPSPRLETARRAASLRQFAGLAVANAAAVAALYWNQAVATSIAADHPGEAGFVSLIPFATLAGYALGVGTIAFVPAASRRVPVRLHLGFLAGALLACGLAPGLPALVLSSLLVGVGASVAQRLLAAAARLAGPDHAGAAIGATVAAALLAVLGVRLGAGDLAEAVGWRAVLTVAAGCAALPAVLLPRMLGEAVVRDASPAPLTSATWRSPMLVRAGVQQAALFAAYNAGWMTLLAEVPGGQRLPVVIGGGATGLLAAMLSGRLVDRFGPAEVARIGAAAMTVGACLLPVAYAAQGAGRTALLLPGMMLLDAGLQAALVANQARVQALLPAARSRLAALLTVCGALGGALGAGAAYGLWHRFGWGGAVSVTAAACLLGLGCCAWPARLFRTCLFRTPGRRRAVSNAPAVTERHGIAPGLRRKALSPWSVEA